MEENHSELTIFEQLEKIRKEKNISLEEISDKTRIPLKHLEAIEKGKDLEKNDLYICPVCGYTHEGKPPDKCPVCGALKKVFKKID